MDPRTPQLMNSSDVFSIIQPASKKLGVIAGPCLAESEDMMLRVAEKLEAVASRHEIQFIFKASYRKANRTSSAGFTGVGDEEALGMMAKVKEKFGFPLLTDVHEPDECQMAAQVCDVLQIPAFLSRQTSLLQAAAATGKVVNIKKGQFMAAKDMGHAREKVIAAGNDNVWLCERGTFFGYGDLVVDFRSEKIMSEFGAPTVFDATHSVQRPSQQGQSGGDREFIPGLVRAAMACGYDGLFIETHPDPAFAMSDKATQWPLDSLEDLLVSALRVREAVR